MHPTFPHHNHAMDNVGMAHQSPESVAATPQTATPTAHPMLGVYTPAGVSSLGVAQHQLVPGQQFMMAQHQHQQHHQMQGHPVANNGSSPSHQQQQQQQQQQTSQKSPHHHSPQSYMTNMVASSYPLSPTAQQQQTVMAGHGQQSASMIQTPNPLLYSAPGLLQTVQHPLPSSYSSSSSSSSAIPSSPFSLTASNTSLTASNTSYSSSNEDFGPPTKKRKLDEAGLSVDVFGEEDANSKKLNRECASLLARKTLVDIDFLLKFVTTIGTTEMLNVRLLQEAKDRLSQFSQSLQGGAPTFQPTIFTELSRSRLEDFNLLDTLGTGTFGKVRLCQNIHTKNYYCMKILSKEKVVRLKQQEHVRNEKQILSCVKHPFIVELYATFQDEHNLFFLMEYVSGGELFTAIKRSGGLTASTARFYAAEMVLVIEYLHQRNIIHRDLKPENLLLDQLGHVKLTDFGFSKEVLDKTWTMCGTPEYIAPEIILSKGHGKGVDWWSLGILIFEMLAGHPPFQGENHYTIFERIISGKVVFPPHFDANSKDLISRLLSIDLTQRFGCMRGGATDVKSHPWFSDIDWESLVSKKVWGPIHPKNVKAENMTSNFEVFTTPSPSQHQSFTGDQDVFKDF